MKIAIICYLFLMNVINFEAVSGLFQHKVDSLSLLKEAYRNRDEKTFFDLFPHSYAKFIAYYGYVENKPMPLYHEAFEHIKFLTSSKICKQKLLDKMVNIAKDAKWEADAPSYLREILIHSIQECPDTILSLLKNKEMKEINNFWYFMLYYPSLNPENDGQYTSMYEQLYRCVNERNKAMGQIIKDVYHRIVVESKCDSLSEVIHKAQGICPYQCYSISYHSNGYKQSEGILLWDVSPDADSTFEYGEWKYYDDQGELVQVINC